MFLSFFIANTMTTIYKTGLVVIVVTGVILSLVNNLELNLYDVLILMVGNLFAALKTILTNVSLKKHNIPPLVLMNFVAPFASLGMLSIAILNGELVTLFHSFESVQMIGLLFVVLTSVLSFFLNTT